MNTHVYKVICIMVLLLSACASRTATQSSLPPTSAPVPPTAVATSESSLVEDAPQTGSTSTRDKVVFILGNLLILSLFSFPMSFAETWAFGDPRKAKNRPKKESPGSSVTTETSAEPTQTIGDEAPDSVDEWTTLSKRLPRWVQGLPRVTAGLLTGGIAMVVVVIVGAAVFALFYHFSGQSEQISQIIPRFAYWFPFALLGMVTDIPFQIIYWENTRLRVLLRLVIWWFPRVVIIAFVINPPILQGLDHAATALTVLAIDCVLAAMCLGLYTAREQLWMNGIR